MNREVRALVRELERQGFTVTITANGRYRVTKDGEFVTVIPAGLGDRRGLLNARAALRRHGFRRQ